MVAALSTEQQLITVTTHHVFSLFYISHSLSLAKNTKTHMQLLFFPSKTRPFVTEYKMTERTDDRRRMEEKNRIEQKKKTLRYI